MTRFEGRILLKLIDRETDHTAFMIIKEFRSGFTAGFWQLVAKIFGNDLKLSYDPDGEDAVLEQIVLYYKAGLLWRREAAAPATPISSARCRTAPRYGRTSPPTKRRLSVSIRRAKRSSVSPS